MAAVGALLSDGGAGVRVGCVSTFTGFSDRALDFYAALGATNTREFWAEHKTVFEDEVRGPMQALVGELEDEFGPSTVFRPHRDTRFSRDKSPYKTHQGALAGVGPGIGYYVQLDATGLSAGGGFHSHGPDQVGRYRDAVDAESTGSELATIVAALRASGFEIEGEQLKTRPRGYAGDHPRIELLRRKSLMAIKRFGAPSWLASPKALDEVRTAWRQVAPLSTWIVANVGAAEVDEP